MAGEFLLDDRQRARLQPMLPNKPRGVPRVDELRVISGIVHVVQSGCRWKDAPSVYGPRKTLYHRNVRWAANGVWRAVFEALVTEGGPPTEVLIDSTHVKAHRSAAGAKGAHAQAIGVNRGGVATPRSTPSPTVRTDRRLPADAGPCRRLPRRRVSTKRLAPALHRSRRPRL